MNFNFTDRVRRGLASAREEAIRLQHGYVGSEHILLGLIREGDGVAAAVLRSLEIDLEQIHERVEESVEKGTSTISSGELPYTAWGKKVLERARAEARDFGHAHVGTEHLLLGVIGEENGVGSQVLASFDLTIERARAETAALLDIDGPVGAREPGSLSRASAAASAQRIGKELLQIWVSPGDATADDLAAVHAAVSEVYRASGSDGTPVPDTDTLSESRHNLVEAIERLRQKGGNLLLRPARLPGDA